MAFDFSDLQGQRFQADMQKASGYKPLIRKDLEAAYGRYGEVGVKMGRVAGKNDAQLYKQATDDVLNWWKRGKEKSAQAAAAEVRRKAQEQAAAQQAAQQAAARPAAPAAQSSGGAGGGGGPMLPNTAMGSGGTPSKLRSLETRADPNYVQLQLARNGFRGAVPPAYALTNVAAFDAWLERAIALRQGIQKPGTFDPKITTPATPKVNATAPQYKATTKSGGARTI